MQRIVFATLLAIATAACAAAGERENQWGPFEGRVVDAESGNAIAGAAVIVFWKKAVLNPVEEHLEFYDVRWAVTETDGRFTVPRRDPPLITLGIGGAFLSCVAPGYLPYEFTPKYDSAVQDSRLRQGTIAVRMRRWPKLTHEEELRRLYELSANNLGSVPADQLRVIEKAVNAKRGTKGLQPIRLRSGELQ